MRSLRQRAIFGGLIWAALCLGAGGIALFNFFDNLILRRFDDALLDRHLQVVVALSNSDADEEFMSVLIPDAAYERPYSGRYWQVKGANEEFLASRSLFDAELTEPIEVTADAEYWEGRGPRQRVRGVSRSVTFEDDTTWIVTVADSLDALADERVNIRQNLITTLGLVGFMGIVGAILQASAVVRPLTKLRQDVAHRWDNEEALNPDDYPEEVSPLVTDINTLLDRNREIVERARRQAADLAHAIKTPSAILRNELGALELNNVDVSEAKQALDRVDAQLQRSLARIRAANSGDSTHSQTDLAVSINRLARLFRSMHSDKGQTLTIKAPETIKVPMDVQDLEEVLGNMLENAFKWCQANVQVTAGLDGQDVKLTIEDDGPGIPEGSRREALRSGGRLDTNSPGTGLGMAIAADLIQAYGGTFDLQESYDLGGLKIAISIPSKHGLGGKPA